jgi:hypothetical protein
VPAYWIRVLGLLASATLIGVVAGVLIFGAIAFVIEAFVDYADPFFAITLVLTSLVLALSAGVGTIIILLMACISWRLFQSHSPLDRTQKRRAVAVLSAGPIALGISTLFPSFRELAAGFFNYTAPHFLREVHRLFT